MADYKKMYIRLFRAVTQSIELLQEAQQDCEELYLSASEPELSVLPGAARDGEGRETHKGR